MAEKFCRNYRELSSDESFSHGTKYSVSDAAGMNNQSVSVIRFDPGEKGPLSYHSEPVEELYFVLEGPLQVQLDEETYVADEGTAAVIPPGVAHRPHNHTDEPAVLLVVQAPPSKDTTYISE
jgi:mannose-6-phosphate isomerase-like protein (cupin superfamily)